jgi:hypothetical protein
VTHLTAALISPVLVLLPWLLHQLRLHDAVPAGGGWSARTRRGTQGASRVLGHDGSGRRGQPRWRIALGIVLGVVLAMTWAPDLLEPLTAASRPFQLAQGSPDTALDETPELPELDHPVDPRTRANPVIPGEIPAAMEGQDWYVHPFGTAQGWSFSLNTVWRPTLIHPVLDFVSDGLSVVDGLRSSWTPGPCECPTVTLWMYGGSTTYGLNQRDEHTIASELARAAHADGIRLEVQNRGVLGYLHWLEAERFAHDLIVDEAPDAVLFYDGANETWATSVLDSRRAGDSRFPADPTLTDVWGYTKRSEGSPPDGPPGARVIGWERGVTFDMTSRAQTTVQRYDRARRLSRASAARYGITALYAWQPTRVSRELVPSEPHGDAQQEVYSRTLDQLQRTHLPADVIDLVDVFDGVPGPIFTDDVHHGERGARIVAESMWKRIRTVVERLGSGEPR